MKKKIIYIDMDEVLADFYKLYEEKIESNPSIRFPQAEYGFFANLEPIQDSIESVKELINCPLFDVYILQNRSNYVCQIMFGHLVMDITKYTQNQSMQLMQSLKNVILMCAQLTKKVETPLVGI